MISCHRNQHLEQRVRAPGGWLRYSAHQTVIVVSKSFLPRQVRWTKTAGGASDRQGDSSQHNETLKIEKISRHQGGRYYCKAENGLGSPAIRSIRVDVYCKL